MPMSLPAVAPRAPTQPEPTADPTGLCARPYQQAGVRFLVDRLTTTLDAMPTPERAVVLADEPGLGKTLQALRAADELGARRVLVIAPAIARVSWPIEIAKFAPARVPHARVVPPEARPDLRRPGSGWLDQPDVLAVLAYDIFSQPRTRAPWLQALTARRWDLLILDEAHYLKNASQRTRAIYGTRTQGGRAVGLEASCARVILLTGTLTPNHAGEMFQHYRTFWSHRISRPMPNPPGARPLNQPEFEERFTRYTDGIHGRRINGSRNQDQLRQALAPVILRRRRADVLPELPRLVCQDVPLVAAPGALHVPALSGAMSRTAHLGHLGDQCLVQELSSAPANAELATLRRVLGEAKVIPAAEWVRERLGVGVDKILVFAWHRSVIAGLGQALLDFAPLTITGETSPAERAAVVDLFQTKPVHRVFIGQILAAGTAVTLTAASDVAIVEPSWVPGENAQAIARAHRLGQLFSVLASFLYLPNTLDQQIMRAYRRKAEEVSELYRD